jgi:hypothetical protein
MRLRNSCPNVLGLVLILAGSAIAIQPRLNQESKSLVHCPANKDTAIRFFYNPPGDYFHFPLIFRPVDETDPRRNTAPMTTEGQTAYISFAEMHRLMEGLARSGLSWKNSERVEVLGSYKHLLPLDNMEVLIICPKRTASAKLAAKEICETLALLDSTLKTPRALWEFQAFRIGYGCKVPAGFETGKYRNQ